MRYEVITLAMLFIITITMAGLSMVVVHALERNAWGTFAVFMTIPISMLLAVLEARCGIAFGGHDVYLNVAGGLKIAEPAADLAVACAVRNNFV